MVKILINSRFFALIQYIIFICCSATANAQVQPEQNITTFMGGKNCFIENKGQWPSEVLYLAKLKSGIVWITNFGVSYAYFKEEITHTPPNKPDPLYDNVNDGNSTQYICHRVNQIYKGSLNHPKSQGIRKLEGYYNYFKGNNQPAHATSVERFKELMLTNVYNGIDVRYYIADGNLRYDFIVNPGANPADIEIMFEGANSLEIVNNEINISTSVNQIFHKDLFAYQQIQGEIIPLSVEWIKKGAGFTFSIINYDAAYPLIIDPLVYSTYLGGIHADYGSNIIIDNIGNSCVVGYTWSYNFDITPGASPLNDAYDAFISKFGSNGTLIYSTCLGGSNDDWGTNIALDSDNNFFIVGKSKSNDFPTTSSSYQPAYQGNIDGFVTKISADGTSIIYSSYIGGNNEDVCTDLVINDAGDPIVVGYTNSSNFDVTAGAFQPTIGGMSDIFVTHFNHDGSGLVFSTYLGGSKDEYPGRILLDSAENPIVIGLFTESSDFDITMDAIDTVNYLPGTNIQRDAFLTIFNQTGSDLIYSTYIGQDQINETFKNIAFNHSENVYVHATSVDIDIPSYVLETFILKINKNNGAVMYKKSIPINQNVIYNDIEIDSLENIFLLGSTQSANYPTTQFCYQSTNKGDLDVILTKFTNQLDSILYSTYLGGSLDEWPSSFALDNTGKMHLIGVTISDDFPTQNPYQSSNDGFPDLFITKLCMPPQLKNLSNNNNNQLVCINNPITDIIFSLDGVQDIAINGIPNGISGTNSGTSYVVSGTPLSVGVFNIIVFVVSDCGVGQYQIGTITVSDCSTSVPSTEIAFGITIFPNPSSTAFTLKLALETHIGGTLHISDVNGRQLASHRITQSNQNIGTAQLAPGIYALAYEHKGQMLWRGKLCVVR
jgi:hypothetical protein